MPLITAVKFKSMAWTGDGRLVLAGDCDRFGKALAMWRPGQGHLAVKRLALPGLRRLRHLRPLARRRRLSGQAGRPARAERSGASVASRSS
jgi:hypothetical protein